MVWTSPHTWTPGELMTAALMNEQLRDNLGYLLAPNHIAVVKNDVDFTLGVTSYTNIHSDFNVPITLHGGHLLVAAKLRFNVAGASAYSADIQFAVGTNTQKVYGTSTEISRDVTLLWLFTGIVAGTYNVAIQAKSSNVAGVITFKAVTDPQVMVAIEL